MKRILAGGLGVTLGLAAAGSQADEVIWRAVGTRAPQAAPISPSSSTPVVAVAAVNPAAPGGQIYRWESGRSSGSSWSTAPAGWARVRAQTESADTPANMPLALPEPGVASQPPPPEPVTSPPTPVAPPVPVPVQSAPPAPATKDAPVVSAVPAPVDDAQNRTLLTCENSVEPAPGEGIRLQASVEYLLWWVKGSQVPPLLTTSPPNGANGIPGAVPGSTVLIGGEDLDDATRHGARFGFVWWIDRCLTHGFDGRLFFTGERTHEVAVSSQQVNGGDISLFRPFFAANTLTFNGVPLPGPFREQVTANGVASGTFTARSTSDFWGAEANYRNCLYCWNDCLSDFRADVLVGFRYVHLDEELNLVEDAVRRVRSADFPDEIAGTRIIVTDRFRTTNDFTGGQVGSSLNYTRNRWTFDLRGTVALGTTHQRLTIDGSQVRAPLANGGTFTAAGGLLALPTNIGEYSRNVLSVVPEVGLNVGYQVTEHWRAFLGYNFLYWSNIARPADQIDPVIDVTRVPRFVPPGVAVPPNGPRPAVLFQNTDFWAQGVNLGVQYQW